MVGGLPGDGLVAEDAPDAALQAAREVAVAHEQRFLVLRVRRAQQPAEVRYFEPDVAEVLERPPPRDGAREERPVDAAGARPGDDVDTRLELREVQQICIRLLLGRLALARAD